MPSRHINLAIAQQRVTAQDKESHHMCQMLQLVQGVFLNWYPPKSSKCFSVSKMF